MRACAPARSITCNHNRVSRGGFGLRKSRLLELTAQASPRSTRLRKLQSALEGAPSLSARPAPPPRAPPRRRRQVRPGGRGLRLPARSPRAGGSGLRGAPPRPVAPSPLRNWTQVGSRARAAALAPSAPRRRRRHCTRERGGRGGARTAERGPRGAPAPGAAGGQLV